MLRQHLIIEEFGADLKYIKGVDNVVAGALFRLPMHKNIEYKEVFVNRRVFQEQVSFLLDLDNIKVTKKEDDHLTRLLKDKRGCDNYSKKKVHKVEFWTVKKKCSYQSKVRKT